MFNHAVAISRAGQRWFAECNLAGGTGGGARVAPGAPTSWADRKRVLPILSLRGQPNKAYCPDPADFEQTVKEHVTNILARPGRPAGRRSSRVHGGVEDDARGSSPISRRRPPSQWRRHARSCWKWWLSGARSLYLRAMPFRGSVPSLSDRQSGLDIDAMLLWLAAHGLGNLWAITKQSTLTRMPPCSAEAVLTR